MSSTSYLESELNLNKKYLPYKDIITDIAKVISEQGHSGGSMSIFGPAFKAFANDPKPIDSEDSLLKPVWLLIKDYSINEQKDILFAASRICTFTPLTPLTGEEDEWMLIYEDEDGKQYQNKRMSNIFKFGDEAYNIDGRIIYEPLIMYNDFVGITGPDSKVDVTFPYDPETEPECIFYTSSKRNKRIVDIDPNEWLKKARSEFMSGKDVDTNHIVKDAYFIKKEELTEFIEFFKSVLNAIIRYECFDDSIESRQNDGVNAVFSELLFYNYTSKFYEYNEARNSVCKHTRVTTNKYSFVRNALRLLTHPEVASFIRDYAGNKETDTILNAFDFRFLINYRDVLVPSKNYQDWISNGDIIPLIESNTPKNKETTSITLFDPTECITPFVVVEHMYKYLYTKCKELNLEYKGKRS